MRGTHVAVLMSAALLASCRSHPAPARREIVVWRNLGAWSSRGSSQTESFTCDTGMLRLRWETRNPGAREARPAGADGPSVGAFRVTVHSAVSGRPLVVAVDHHGVGHDTAYVNEDPREFYLVVDSSDVDWNIAVDEGIPATADARQQGS